MSIGFSCVIAACVVLFAGPLMRIFVQAEETAVIAAGIRYLRIEGAFYAGIGCLFLLYGFYRAVKRPGMSVVLTVISLGTRVVLGLCPGGPRGGGGHLGRHPHRLGAGGRRGLRLLLPPSGPASGYRLMLRPPFSLDDGTVPW